MPRRSLAAMMTLWRLKGFVLSDEILYDFVSQVPLGRTPDPKRRMQVRKAIVVDKRPSGYWSNRAEVIYRANIYGGDVSESTIGNTRGLINADLIFRHRDEEFITNASLRQLETHIDGA